MSALAETFDAVTGEILPPLKGDIAAYDPFRAQLAELETENASIVFAYETPAGAKEARSHIYKLRQSRAALDRARKAEKDESLQRGRKIDAEAKEIEARIEAMIDIHQNPLDEIEQREKDRLATIQRRVDVFIAAPQLHPETSSADITAVIATVEAVAIDDSFAELRAQAAIAKDEALISLRVQLQAALKREETAAELARLQAEEAERQQRVRIEEAQRQAAEQATRDAEARAATERQAAADRELALHRQAQEAEAARAAAEKRAEEAAAAERKRIADEQVAQAAVDAKRQADKEHRWRVNAAAAEAITSVVITEGVAITEAQARAIILAIIKGEVPNVSVNY